MTIGMSCGRDPVSYARDFVMKDAYSFHADRDSLRDTYKVMREAYGSFFAGRLSDQTPCAGRSSSRAAPSRATQP
jgi:prolyl-tRNA synthetase